MSEEAHPHEMLNLSQKEDSSVEEMRKSQLKKQLNDEMNPRRSLLHQLFILVSLLVVGSAVVMLIGQFVGIAFKTVGPIQAVLRVYVILLCILVILNELEWFSLTTESKILSWWVTRGAVYAFIGVLGLEENSNSSNNENAAGRDMALTYVKVVAWIMVGCGVLYFFMGVLCLQIVSNRLKEDYKRKRERAKEVRRTMDTYGTGNVV